MIEIAAVAANVDHRVDGAAASEHLPARDHFPVELIEDWIKANLTGGHNLLAAAVADPYYYPITEPKTSINTAAYNTSYWAGGTGKRVWDAYVASGYPTTAGSGNATLVAGAKEMMIRAIRYTRGTIKYAFDTYGQWTARY